MTDYSWVSTADGDWSDSGAWNPTGVPDSNTATATIDASGTYTVEINNTEGFAVDSVTLNSADATLSVDGTLSLNSGFRILAGKGITGAGFLNVTGGSIGGGSVAVSNQQISGAVTLSANLTDSGTVSLGFADTDTLAFGSHTLKLTGAGSIIAGTLTGNGMLALAGGDQRVDAGASLGMAKLSMSGGDSLSLTASLTYAGTLMQGANSGLTIASGNALTLTGSAMLSGSVNGSVNVNDGSLVLNTAGTGAMLTLNSSSLSVVNNLSYGGGLADRGGTIALGGRTLALTGRNSLTNVAVMTAGVLYTRGRTTLAGVSVKAGATLGNLGTTTVKGQIVLGDLNSAGQLVNAKGATLTLTSGQTAAATIVDPAGRNADSTSADATTRPASVVRNKGLVQLSRGGSKGGVRGTVDTTSHIAVAFQNLDTGTVKVESGTLEFDAAFTNTDTNAGAISVASSTVLDFNGGGSSNAGAFSIAAGGLLEFTGGVFSLRAGTIQGAASVTGGTLELGSDAVTITGGLTQSGGSVIDGSGILTVTGASFSGTGGAVQTGAGETALQGNTTVAENIAIDGGRIFENDGTLTWTGGNFQLGRNPSGTSAGGGFVRNKGTFIIAYDGVIRGYRGSTAFINRGTVSKGNAGSVLVATEFLNQGRVNVSKGTLELGGTLFGSGGSFHISNGAVLVADAAVAAKQTLVFGPTGGQLIVKDAAEFGAKISGFGAQSAIDLTGFKFSGNPKATFVEAATNKQGVLTVTDGSQTLKITLFGQYVAAGFHLASDGAAGGTVVTYTAPAAQVLIATPH